MHRTQMGIIEKFSGDRQFAYVQKIKGLTRRCQIQRQVEPFKNPQENEKNSMNFSPVCIID